MKEEVHDLRRVEWHSKYPILLRKLVPRVLVELPVGGQDHVHAVVAPANAVADATVLAGRGASRVHAESQASAALGIEADSSMDRGVVRTGTCIDGVRSEGDIGAPLGKPLTPGARRACAFVCTFLGRDKCWRRILNGPWRPVIGEDPGAQPPIDRADGGIAVLKVVDQRITPCSRLLPPRAPLETTTGAASSPRTIGEDDLDRVERTVAGYVTYTVATVEGDARFGG